MKRNRYGINFDLGIPLVSEDDFALLYVELEPHKMQRLIKWIKNENESPIIVSGQIGTGKTTFITKAFKETKQNPDIKICFDTDVPFYVQGAFWGVFLGKVIEFASKKNVDLIPFQLSKDLLFTESEEPDKLVAALCKKPITLSDFNEKRKLFNIIDENIEAIQKQIEDIIKLIENKIERKLFVFAEGVDKFENFRAEYTSLLDLLNFISKYKTLFEANFIHLFGSTEKWQKSKKLLLNNVSYDKVSETLIKRLGVYHETRADILPILSQLSGGNLRQGLRLLMEYDFASGKMSKDEKESIEYSCQRVREDFLNMTTSVIEPELFKAIKRDKYITTGVISDLVSREYTQNAVYLNWILIKDEADEQLKWPATVNPLLLPAIDSIKDIPDSPEVEMLKKWAEAHDVSHFGLEIDTAMVDQNNLFGILNNVSNRFITLNISSIFEKMASFFLNDVRKDKIIIAYENPILVNLANDYLLGRAGVFKPGKYKEIILGDEKGEKIFEKILSEINGRDYDGYSVFFKNKLHQDDLVTIDKKRDSLIDYKMIWWIQFEHLKSYFIYWTHLRQLFKIYRLEEDILSNITKEEIEEDLEDIKHIDFLVENKEEMKKRLEKVLNYLKAAKDE
jgi:hypothetical protein